MHAVKSGVLSVKRMQGCPHASHIELRYLAHLAHMTPLDR